MNELLTPLLHAKYIPSDHRDLGVPRLRSEDRERSPQELAAPGRIMDQSSSTEKYKEREFGVGVIVEVSKPESGQEMMDTPVLSLATTIDEKEDDDVDMGRQINRAYSTLPKKYNPVKDSVVCQRDRTRTRWEEAALYVYEGEDAKFYHHPGSKWSRKAYKLLHHPAYHILHLVVCLLLLSLASLETPSVVNEETLTEAQHTALISVHGILEILFLSFLSVDLFLRFVWLGLRHFVKHRRTVVISLITIVMYMEVLAVLIRQRSHIRITRVLRPIFVLDTYYFGGVRRVMRQIFLSLKPIAEVLFLLLFFIVFFSLFGYIIFSRVDPVYFNSFTRSCVSIFITLTTANNPDVMMESYGQYPATPIFFVIYIVVTLYFATNVLLAVVYSSFSAADKNKFRKLLFHKRDALRRAFDILSFDPCSELQRIKFHDFLRFMHHYRPRKAEWQVMCIYKALHSKPQDQCDGLTLEEFYSFYEVIDYKWEEVLTSGEKVVWFTYLSPRMKRPFHGLHIMVTHRVYKFAVGLIVLVNLLFLVIYSSMITNNDEIEKKFRTILPVSFCFLFVYIVDIVLSIIGHGIFNYFKKFWNLADFLMIMVSFICLCLEIDPKFGILLFIRPLKLIRLIRLKRSYRDIMNTIIDLAPRLISISFLVLIIFYVFAIIGLEFLSGLVHPGCCNSSWYDAGRYYSGRIDHGFNDTNTVNVYFLNNFDNILRSYVTLFILMVVNNWYIIMEGFTSEVNTDHRWLSRLYFLSFYIITLVVLQVVISFIVEAFVFKIQATQRRRICNIHPDNYTCNCRQEKKKTVTVTLEKEDISKLRYEVTYLDEQLSKQRLTFNRLLKHLGRRDFTQKHHSFTFVGRRLHTKEDVHQLMYKDEIKNWVQMEKHKKKNKNVPILTNMRQKAMMVMEFLLD